MPVLFYYLHLKFYFYSNEHEPIHVHVSTGQAEAKFNITPTTKLIENHGLKARDIRIAIKAIEDNRDIITRQWKMMCKISIIAGLMVIMLLKVSKIVSLCLISVLLELPIRCKLESIKKD